MSRSRSYRAPFVVTLSVASTLAACGGSTASDTSASGGAGGSGNGAGSGGSGNVSGSGGSGGSPETCPSTFPQNGSSCALPSGTSCVYDQGACCPPWQATCVEGKWQGFASTCNPPPPPLCPDSPPQQGTPCGTGDPCSLSMQVCTYGKCADGTPYMTAICENGTWSVVTSKCLLPACDGLSACDCFDRPDCEALTDTCLCPCDFNCPGKPPCACACGGGKYLGCKAK